MDLFAGRGVIACLKAVENGTIREKHRDREHVRNFQLARKILTVKGIKTSERLLY